MQTARTNLHYVGLHLPPSVVDVEPTTGWLTLGVSASPWSLVDVDELGPTVVYRWDHVSSPYATTQRAYVDYSNELDVLSPSTVSFEHSFHTQYLKYPLITYYLIVFLR